MITIFHGVSCTLNMNSDIKMNISQFITL